uniref:WD_REPEATS_REGION domain-containing protein n=1 Tax=Rhabditophanes sp. KR3021 TaxID=114890 RepID=A0AC35UC20_9BILA
MGLTKDYLKFEASGICNIIASHNGNIHAIDRNTVAATACEAINFYNARTRKRTSRILRDEKLVTAFQFSQNNKYLAVGYEDGEIHVFDRELENFEKEKVVFSGHKTGVNCLTFSNDGLTLASGGKDSVIVIWDIVNESGICRLNGHKNAVTCVKFTLDDQNIISASKDTTVKFWNLTAKCCFYTIAETSTEVYSLALIKEDRMLVVGTADIELRVYELLWNPTENTPDNSEPSGKIRKLEPLVASSMVEEENTQGNTFVKCKKRGLLLRQAKKMALEIVVSRDDKLMLVVGNDQSVDVFKIHSEEEAQKRFFKKVKKAKKRTADEAEENDALVAELGIVSDVSKDVTILISRLGDLKGNTSIKALSICNRFVTKESGIEYRIFTLQRDNSIVAYDCIFSDKNNTFSFTNAGDFAKLGQRSDIRALAINSKNTHMVTGDSVAGYYWNINQLGVLNVMEHKDMRDIVGALFVYNDQYVIFTCKSGSIFVFHVGTSEMVENKTKCHEGAINGIVSDPSGHGFITIVEEFEEKRLSFGMTREIELPDDGLCVAVSPNGKYLVVGLLDNTARIYFIDTLKFFAALYGHSLPVYCIDVCPENKLIITGSSDKSVKIWGLDFADCHRSLFAHDDVVTNVKFSTNKDEKLFWSSGRDGVLKQWDAVKFVKIQTLKGHSGDVRCLAQSTDSKFIVSASSDKSIRCWDLTEEIIVLSEQEEMDREKEFEAKMVEEEDIIPGDLRNQEADLANQKTIESIKNYEDIVDALMIVREEALRMDNEDKYVPHPLIANYGSKSLDHFVIDAIAKIRTTNIERALLMVSYDYVKDILKACVVCAKAQYHIELVCKIVNLTVRVHHNYLLNTPEIAPILAEIVKSCEDKVEHLLEILDFNSAALALFKAELDESEKVKMTHDLTGVTAKPKAQGKKVIVKGSV